MQTFLPYSDFSKSARCLDRQRLGKQRVEVLQLLNALAGKTRGWINHPAASMWSGYESTLALYGDIICEEWIERKYHDTCRGKIRNICQPANAFDYPKPQWLGDEAFHAAHRSNLLRKMPEHYKQFGWAEPDTLPYIWPAP